MGAYNVGATVLALELLALVDSHSVGAVVAPPILLRMHWMMIATSFWRSSSEATCTVANAILFHLYNIKYLNLN